MLGILALLSLALVLWQWLAAARFPLHQRRGPLAQAPGITLLKPLKGADACTEACLRSWFQQHYSGPLEILFAVAAPDDPAVEVVQALQREFPERPSELLICDGLAGVNAKIAKLARLEPRAAHEIIVISDADVRAPPDLLAELARELQPAGAGLVNCFYRLANASTPAMRWEALAVNADFWSQVLQARTLKPMDFALGAVMMLRRSDLAVIGGFAALENCLADDFQLGHRLARQGKLIALSTVVVDCLSAPQTWRQVWSHQLRWARTIRVCQPAPYFFSILSNGTLWPLLWALWTPGAWTLGFLLGCLALRVLCARDLENRLAAGVPQPGAGWLAPLKDLLQTGLWALAFAGSHVEWRGRRLRVRADGSLTPVAKPR